MDLEKYAKLATCRKAGIAAISECERSEMWAEWLDERFGDDAAGMDHELSPRG
jgi:hypothetical protein